jgi:hypothetical protein
MNPSNALVTSTECQVEETTLITLASLYDFLFNIQPTLYIESQIMIWHTRCVYKLYVLVISVSPTHRKSKAQSTISDIRSDMITYGLFVLVLWLVIYVEIK